MVLGTNTVRDTGKGAGVARGSGEPQFRPEDEIDLPFEELFMHQAFRKGENYFNDLALEISTIICLPFHLSTPFQIHGQE